MKKFLPLTLAGLMAFGAVYSAAPVAPVSAATPLSATAQAKADEIIKIAESLIGQATYSTAEYKTTYPYKFSCATFIDYVFKQAGVDIATYNEDFMQQMGEFVPRDQLQKGDIIIFDANKTTPEPDHVGVYYGNNKVIHMADPKQHIIISDMAAKPYYTTAYVEARRVIPDFLPSNPPTKADQAVSLAYSLKTSATIANTNSTSSMTFTNPGFANYVFGQIGYSLGTNNVEEQMKLGTTVPRSELKKGDLVFFGNTAGSTTPSIVGIYVANNVVIVPNSSSGVLSRTLFVDYYKDRYITAKRVLPVEVALTEQDKLVNTAEGLIGKVKYGYSYSPSTLTFTGAGFTYYVYSQYGIDLKEKIASRQAQMGTAVAKADLKKGDLVFFSLNNSGTDITHAGIYAGNNEVIHLSRTNGLVKESLSSDFATKNYVTARRVM
ncbi:C40 family peptidase [Brevibacillus dissolubilis]|uniref:C40 family peptidase n=1 Tax=Brevibacillus dissolubilis TaxID=1844116 RepID=UPI002100087C|nr:NlpC/P60 family protein [Brevibacillus dissolubilis]